MRKIDISAGTARILSKPAATPPPTVTLARGLSGDMALSDWQQQVLAEGDKARAPAAIVLYDSTPRPVAPYELLNAWPSKVELNATRTRWRRKE